MYVQVNIGSHTCMFKLSKAVIIEIDVCHDVQVKTKTSVKSSLVKA